VGIDIGAQQARFVLWPALWGLQPMLPCRTHSGVLIEKHGPDKKINLGTSVELEAPIIRTVLGLKPETLGDLKIAIEYVYKEITHLLDSTAMGQEGSLPGF